MHSVRPFKCEPWAKFSTLMSAFSTVARSPRPMRKTTLNWNSLGGPRHGMRGGIWLPRLQQRALPLQSNRRGA